MSPKEKYAYDLEIVIPVCTREHYFQRLVDFKKYGLFNPGKYKVKVVLLSDPNEPADNLKNGWKPEYTIQIFQSPKIVITPKICSYYTDCLPKYIHLPNESARWYARVDDDSVTDISGLIDNLDRWYDYTEPFYLATSLRTDTEDDLLMGWGVEEVQALKKSGQDHLILKFDQEWESSFLSHAAMTKILTNKTSIRFIKERSLIETGPGDKFLGAAAKIAKVYPMNCPFTTKDDLYDDFSYTGGRYNHIHFVARDINPDKYLVFVISLDDKHVIDNNFTDINSPLYHQLVGKDYVFYNNNNLLGILTLSPMCRITNYKNPNEFLWKVGGNQLEFITTDGKTSSIFENITNPNYMVGNYILGEEEIQHHLRRLYPKPSGII